MLNHLSPPYPSCLQEKIFYIFFSVSCFASWAFCFAVSAVSAAFSLPTPAAAFAASAPSSAGNR